MRSLIRNCSFAFCIGAVLVTAAEARPDWVDPLPSMRVTCGYVDPNYKMVRCTPPYGGLDPDPANQKEHTGTDFAAVSGTPVRSPVAGTVVISRTNVADPMQKYMVIRDSATGEEHVFGHVDSLITQGQQVQRGQVVANIARWSNSHLHWGFNVNVTPNAKGLRGVAAVTDGVWGFGRAPLSTTREQIQARGWRPVL